MDEFEVTTSLTNKSFWVSVNILITKPHVVNKRLWGCKALHTTKCTILDMGALHITLQNSKLGADGRPEMFIENVVSKIICSGQKINYIVELIMIELLPKSFSENHAYQIVVIDKANDTAMFYDVSCTELKQNISPTYPYSFTLNNGKIILKTFGGNSKSTSWLRDVVLPHIVKWGQEANPNKLKQNVCSESLQLVDNDQYYNKYNVLKIKYGKELVKIWPESTDPLKFVYEDIAIASYLLLLWDNDNKKSQHFVDVGCGNGLLVYILNMEGHNGVGIDVRKRKIWDMYPENVKLEEKTFTPSDINDFSTADWIIGNHSDELTPWVPVIAAKSSYNCKFFLLPCCAYNFDGTKYERHDSSKSQYTEYLEYIKALCDDIGFETHFDRLKIPSTKRICLVGIKRAYPETEYNKYCNDIEELIKSELENKHDSTDFKTREKVERVRNCTQVDKTIIDSIITCVTKYMLEGCKLDSTWTTGRETEISDLVNVIPDDMLKRLKSECGGLQTLLKNNHHIFQVINGKVQFRYPKSTDEVRRALQSKNKDINKVKMQVKKCWFYNNHPQGCPLDNNTCSFLHVQAEPLKINCSTHPIT